MKHGRIPWNLVFVCGRVCGVTNWPSYDRALVQRGDITMWGSEDALDAWKPRPSRRRGGQKRYSDTAIETTLTLRLFFNLPLRQTEGFLRSLSRSTMPL